ncbi:MAG: histidine kinase, partial [Bacteroidota bacterium]
MHLKKVFFLLFIVFSINVYSQESLPFVENFTKSDYAGDNQVWNVVQGNDNAIYFANHHFLLRYDGVVWEKYILPNKTIIRSVFADGDKIYCGSYKEFGYWQRVNGTMHYTSLSKNKNLFLGNADNEEIWKIFKLNDIIYFQAFNQVCQYDGKTVKSIKFPAQVSYCYVVDNKVYAASVRNGVYSLQGNAFKPENTWPQLKETVVHGIEKCGNQIFVFTKNNGIYVGDAIAITPWASPINSLLKNDIILTAKVVDNHTIAIGTALRGLYIIDIATNTYKNINRENGIKNNAVLSILLDNEHDLWLGLDNGIAHVEINSPVSLFTDNSGILGSVYALSECDKGYLFATNHGLFTYSNGLLHAVNNSQGQTWDIYKNGSQYIVGHNDGTFVFNSQGLIKSNPINGGWNFIK